LPLSEFDLIAKHFAPMAAPGGLGLLDDAAILALPRGAELVISKDMLVETVHFLPDDLPGVIAAKALRVNLSDLAAKGAKPLGFMLGLAKPKTLGDDWLAAFAAALKDDAETYGCPLYGGDTVSTEGPLTVSITVFGAVPRGRIVRRLATEAGDHLYVTGCIGDSALGVTMRYHPDAPWIAKLSAEHRKWLADAYLLPWPRNNAAALIQRHARAAMDISDGFAGDLTKMIQGAGLGATVELAQVPLSPAVLAAVALDPALFETALTGGDDYEVLMAVPPENASATESDFAALSLRLTRIGVAGLKGAAVRFLKADRSEQHFAKMSFRHF
jgi:thiamine-monophosphate kinase